MICKIAFAISSGSPGGTRRPFLPWIIMECENIYPSPSRAENIWKDSSYAKTLYLILNQPYPIIKINLDFFVVAINV